MTRNLNQREAIKHCLQVLHECESKLQDAKEHCSDTESAECFDEALSLVKACLSNSMKKEQRLDVSAPNISPAGLSNSTSHIDRGDDEQ